MEISLRIQFYRFYGIFCKILDIFLKVKNHLYSVDAIDDL